MKLKTFETQKRNGIHTSRLMHHDSRGFTITELLVVIGLVGVIAGIGYVTSIGAFQRYQLVSERDFLVSILQKARSYALSNAHESAHGVFIDEVNSRYIFFRDEDGNGEFDATEPFEEIPAHTGITYTFNGDVDEIVFEQVTGNADDAGVITLTGMRSIDVVDIEVSFNGRIDF